MAIVIKQKPTKFKRSVVREANDYISGWDFDISSKECQSLALKNFIDVLSKRNKEQPFEVRTVIISRLTAKLLNVAERELIDYKHIIMSSISNAEHDSALKNYNAVKAIIDKLSE